MITLAILVVAFLLLAITPYILKKHWKKTIIISSIVCILLPFSVCANNITLNGTSKVLEDMFIVSNNDYTFSFIKWDMSFFSNRNDISLGQSLMYLYEDDDFDDDDILAYFIPNESIKLVSGSSSSILNNTKINMTSLQLLNNNDINQMLNITNITQQFLSNKSNRNMTVRLEDPDFNTPDDGSIGNTAFLFVGDANGFNSNFYSVNAGPNPPMLNITYTDYIDFTSPTDESWIYNNQNIEFNATTYSGCNESVWIEYKNIYGIKINMTLGSNYSNISNTTMVAQGDQNITIYCNNSLSEVYWDTNKIYVYNNTVVNITKDTQIYSDSSYDERNYGLTTRLDVGDNINVGTQRSMVYSALSLSSSFIMKNISLNLFAYDNSLGDFIYLYKINHFWEEGTGSNNVNNETFNGTTEFERWYGDNANDGNTPFNSEDPDWQTSFLGSGTDYNSTIISQLDVGYSNSHYFTFPINPVYIQDWIDNSSKNNGFFLSEDSNEGGVRFTFNSSETGSPPFFNVTWMYSNPSFSTPSIAPSVAFTNNSLNCSVTVVDPAGGSVQANFNWFNQSVKFEGGDSNMTCSSGGVCYSVLDQVYTNHFYNLTCSVRVNNSNFFSLWSNSTAINISNWVPSTSNPLINDSNPLTTEDLSCLNYSMIDADLEDNIFVWYQWLNSSDGGSYVSVESFNMSNVSAGQTHNGEYWKCRLWVGDGYVNSSNYTSAPVVINLGNSAPVINNVNATWFNHTLSVVSSSTNNDSKILFTVNFTDADNDAGRLHICKANNFDGALEGCQGGEWCNSTYYYNPTIANCSINASMTDSSARYWAFINSSLYNLPSASSAGEFWVNHYPEDVPIITSGNAGTAYSYLTTPVTVSWSALFDRDNDTVTYILYGGSTENTSVILSNQTGLNYLWSVSAGNTYFWKVSSKDDNNYGSWLNSSVYNFSINSVPVTPPVAPGGGGGETTVIESPVNLSELVQCGDGRCDSPAETISNCPLDCSPDIDLTIPSFFCWGDECIWKDAGFAMAMFIITIVLLLLAVGRKEFDQFFRKRKR